MNNGLCLIVPFSKLSKDLIWTEICYLDYLVRKQRTFKTRDNGIGGKPFFCWLWLKLYNTMNVEAEIFTIDLPFILLFIEFCLSCWCFDFHDSNFLISRFIIGESFLTFLIFLSITSRFPLIFVFWNCETSYWSAADRTFFLTGCQILQTWAEQRRVTRWAVCWAESCCSYGLWWADSPSTDLYL